VRHRFAAGQAVTSPVSTMSHQGYTARIEFDERDGILVGRLLGVRAIISFHGQTVTELRKAFENTVNDYLAECIETRGACPS
jgi:predicted HicB family RNase H-like nuclease